jgi:hypothetical protein
MRSPAEGGAARHYVQGNLFLLQDTRYLHKPQASSHPLNRQLAGPRFERVVDA